MAENLLRSCRHFCPKPLPFALLCDRENEYTSGFDDVILFKDGASNSYLDKLALADYAPYDETIFIDADCLAFGDLNRLFDWFAEADDMSCFGRVLPLDDKTGWFEYENLEELKEEITYVVGLHGGIYYIRKTPIAKKVFDTARDLISNYEKFSFKGKFAIGDEPLIALSMALNNCHPIPFQLSAIACYWEYFGAIDIDIAEGKAELVKEQPKIHTNLVHWGTRFTRELEYKKQISLLDILEAQPEDMEEQLKHCRTEFDHRMSVERRNQFFARVKNKVKRTIGLK